MGEFAAEVDAWTRKAEARLLAVRNTAIQDMIRDMQRPEADGGRIPIRDGFLRASLTAVIGRDKPALTSRPETGTASWNPGEISLVIEGAPIEAPLTFAYTMAYAMRQHYGFVGQDSLGRTYNQAGRHWVTLTAQNWQRYVSEAAARARAGELD